VGVQFISGLLFFFVSQRAITHRIGAIPKYTLHAYFARPDTLIVSSVQRADPRFVNYNCLLLSLHKTKSNESHKKQANAT